MKVLRTNSLYPVTESNCRSLRVGQEHYHYVNEARVSSSKLFAMRCLLLPVLELVCRSSTAPSTYYF